MDSETLQTLNDLRGRVVQARTIQANGDTPPEGLMPSDEELRNALKAVRESRGITASPTKAKTKNGGIDQNFDLNSLFD